jgi:hypothetical protein
MRLITLVPCLTAIASALPQGLDFSVDGGDASKVPGNPTFDLTMTEYCLGGKVAAMADFVVGNYKSGWDFDTLDAHGKPETLKMLSGEHLKMVYDYDRHVTKFTYGACSFDSESRSGCGVCQDVAAWQTPWSSKALDCPGAGLARTPDGKILTRVS